MGGAISADQKTPPDQQRERGYLKDISSKHRVQSPSEDGMSPHRGNDGGKSYRDHEPSEKYAEAAQAHVPLHAIGGNERYLRNEQENPAGKNGSMKMNEQAGQLGMKHTRKIVGPCEANKNGDEYEDGHGGKEEIVAVLSDWD